MQKEARIPISTEREKAVEQCEMVSMLRQDVKKEKEAKACPKFNEMDIITMQYFSSRF